MEQVSQISKSIVHVRDQLSRYWRISSGDENASKNTKNVDKYLLWNVNVLFLLFVLPNVPQFIDAALCWVILWRDQLKLNKIGKGFTECSLPAKPQHYLDVSSLLRQSLLLQTSHSPAPNSFRFLTSNSYQHLICWLLYLTFYSALNMYNIIKVVR